jgi:hypothetical protein
MSIPKRLNHLRDQLAAEGITVTDCQPTRNGHYLLTLERLGETRVATIAGTSGDRRAVLNNLTMAKRLFRMAPLPRGVRAA